MAKKSRVKVDLSGLRQIGADLKTLADGNYRIRVGIFGDKNARWQSFETSAGRAVSATHKEGVTNAEIGFIHEMGSHERGIPRRSFLYDTFKNHMGMIAKPLAQGVRDLFKKGKVMEYLHLVGAQALLLVSEAFDTGGFGKWKTHSPETVKRTGPHRLLWLSGQLHRAVTFKVVRS
jgi:hypothetical protein